MTDPRYESYLAGHVDGEDLWVFAYGSLMWNPGFAVAERRSALLRGFHRRFCVVSEFYRGTPERPGLVLGLDRGGACRGVVLRVAGEAVPVLRYLWDREMITHVYRPLWMKVATGREPVTAITFVADRAHPQYTAERDPVWAAHTIGAAIGQSGTNRAYLEQTIQHLAEAGIHDRNLQAVLDALPA